MAVKLNVQANVTGQGQLTKLNTGLKSLGTQALIAKRKLAALEAGAARSRATFAALGTTLKVGVGVGLAAVTVGIGKFVKDTFDAGKLTESLQVRFKLLFGTVEEGGRAFKVMNKFASKVPFSLEAIAAGSGNLAVISKDASELNKILEVTGNVAAATGLDFRQTAEQIQRSFAGGIAAADVFRERGVRAMLGFEVGAKVSIEETKKRFFEVFANGGQFSKATNDFEQTLEAQVSFVQDAYFRFRQAAAKPLFAGVKAQLVELVGDFKENDEQLKALAITVGENLAKGFKKLGKFVKSVIDNFDKLVTAIKALIALKVAGIIGGIATQFVLLARNIKLAGGAMLGLNIAMRANPLGIFITVIQGAVIAVVLFNDKIKALGKTLMKNFNENLKHIQINFLKFKNMLNIGDEDVNLEGIEKLEDELRNLSNRWDEAAEAKFAYLNGSGNRFDDETKKLQNRKNYVQPYNPRGDMRGEEVAAEEDRIKKMADAQNRAWNENRGRIVIDAMEKNAANERAIEAIRVQREGLASIGIEAKSIATTIGDTWVNGIRAGNSLLQITKDSFKNILATIAETMLRKSIEYGVELLFQALLGDKINKEKQITKEKQKQLMYAIATAAVGGGGGGGGGSFFGMAEGGVVPGGAPYTDRVPTMLTPGEVVIPRDKVGQQSSVTNNTINISGNVDQRAIDQIRSVISSSPSHVGGANKNYTRNTSGLRNRGK